MKTKTAMLLGVLTLGVSSLLVLAENQGRPEAGPGHRPPPPVIGALDANHDGVLDAAEIANASKALLTLDANNDGQLTQEELRPPRPQGERGGPRPEGGPATN